MKSGIIHHATLGDVVVTVRDNRRLVSARWKNGIAHVNIPRGITPDEALRYIDSLAPRLLARRTTLQYHAGQRIELDGLTIIISTQRHRPDTVIASIRNDVAAVEVGANLDFTDPEVTRIISNILCRIAMRVAERILIPRARQVAASLGVTPASWHIMHGYTVLGKCTSRRAIHLSHALVFLTPELRDYIVCHELAHLSEMSHSPRFHAICNSYCNGRESQLIAALKTHKWCIFRR